MCVGAIATTVATAALTDDTPAVPMPLEPSVPPPPVLRWSTAIASIPGKGAAAAPLPGGAVVPVADDVDTNGDNPFANVGDRMKASPSGDEADEDEGGAVATAVAVDATVLFVIEVVWKLSIS